MELSRASKGPLLLAVLFALAGCSGTGVEPSEPDPALPGGFLETNRTGYDAELRTGGGLGKRVEVTIPYVTHNPTTDTLYLPGCRRPSASVLQKRVGRKWQKAYAPVVPLCRRIPPWKLAPGETRRDTLQVSGSLPGQNMAPTFDAEEIAGTYRLSRKILRGRWKEPSRRHLSDEQSVSNTFTLE